MKMHNCCVSGGKKCGTVSSFGVHSVVTPFLFWSTMFVGLLATVLSACLIRLGVETYRKNYGSYVPMIDEDHQILLNGH